MAIINVPEAITPPFTPEFRVIDRGEQAGSYSTISYIENGIESVEEDLTKQRTMIQMSYVTTYEFEPGTLKVFCNGVVVSSVYDYEEMGRMSFRFIQRNAVMSKWLKPDGIIIVKYVRKMA